MQLEDFYFEDGFWKYELDPHTALISTSKQKLVQQVLILEAEDVQMASENVEMDLLEAPRQ